MDKRSEVETDTHREEKRLKCRQNGNHKGCMEQKLTMEQELTRTEIALCTAHVASPTAVLLFS